MSQLELPRPDDRLAEQSSGGQVPYSRLPAWRQLFRIPSERKIPARVAAALAMEEERSEVIVTLVQMVALVTFGTLYTLSPKAFPDSVPFEPVPVALAIYAGFTLVRLLLALRGRLGPWFLSLSVVVDILLLMVTIWSFHLQYVAPPAIYLKAPTLMYVFILIALRALRFRPGYVILTGITGAVGWLVLVAYALTEDPNATRTHSFKDYAMSNDILLGAEFDKVVSILMVTAILALAIVRARSVLLRAVIEEHAAAELSRFFAPEVAGRISRADMAIKPGEAELREAAILFVDMRGFTTFSATLRPTEVMTLLSEYQTCMVDAIGRFGGSIDKFLGDGILASFGAVTLLPDPVCQALRAAEAVREAGLIWAEERMARGLTAPRVVAAVASGQVMFGAVGSAERLEYTVIGDPVNLAAKLEKHGKVEVACLLCPADCFDRAMRQGFAPAADWQRRDARTVAGHEGPLDLNLVVDA